MASATSRMTLTAFTASRTSLLLHVYSPWRRIICDESYDFVECCLPMTRMFCRALCPRTISHTYCRINIPARGCSEHFYRPFCSSSRALSTLGVESSRQQIIRGHNGSVSHDIFLDDKAVLQKASEGSVVLRQPLPRNFIRETFLPHLEYNVAYNAHKFPPSVVLQIAIAYSKLPVHIRQRAIEDCIIETFIDRMVDYGASDCVQLLNTCLQLQGLRNIKVYKAILHRLKDKHVFGSISVLNRLGIVRGITRLLQRAHIIQDDVVAPIPLDIELLDVNNYRISVLKPWTVITSRLHKSELKSLCSELVDFGADSLLPQLEFEMQNLDSYELSDLLGVLAERAERDSAKSDFPIIAILMQRIMELNDDTPMVNKLSNICSLCRLNVYHDRYLYVVIGDMQQTRILDNIFHRHLARVVWAFSRFHVLDRVFDILMPHIERNVYHFEPSSLARLAQIYSAEQQMALLDTPRLRRLSEVLVLISLQALKRIRTFNTKELVFFFAGLCYLRLLPEREDYEAFMSGRLRGVLDYRESQPQEFEPQLKATGMTRTHFLEKVLSSMERLDNDFDLSEIQRVISITHAMHHAHFVLSYLPTSWALVIKEYDGNTL